MKTNETSKLYTVNAAMADITSYLYTGDTIKVYGIGNDTITRISVSNSGGVIKDYLIYIPSGEGRKFDIEEIREALVDSRIIIHDTWDGCYDCYDITEVNEIGDNSYEIVNPNRPTRVFTEDEMEQLLRHLNLVRTQTIDGCKVTETISTTFFN